MRPDIRRTLILFLAVLLSLSMACTKEEGPRPDCAINDGPCTRTIEGLAVKLDITPRPVRAMRDLTFDLQLTRAGRAVRDAEATIDLTMPGMNMGENRVRLRQDRDGVFRGRGVFVRCPSGQTLWKASVIVAEDERETLAVFLLEAP